MAKTNGKSKRDANLATLTPRAKRVEQARHEHRVLTNERGGYPHSAQPLIGLVGVALGLNGEGGGDPVEGILDEIETRTDTLMSAASGEGWDLGMKTLHNELLMLNVRARVALELLRRQREGMDT